MDGIFKLIGALFDISRFKDRVNEGSNAKVGYYTIRNIILCAIAVVVLYFGFACIGLKIGDGDLVAGIVGGLFGIIIGIILIAAGILMMLKMVIYQIVLLVITIKKACTVGKINILWAILTLASIVCLVVLLIVLFTSIKA